MRWKSGCFVLFAFALASTAIAGETTYPAVATTSCGSFEGGAFHVSFVTEYDEVLVYADDLSHDPWIGTSGGPGPHLEVLACDVSVGKCSAATDAALTIKRRPRDRIDGTLSYTDADGDKHGVKFEAKLRWFGAPGFCG